MEEAGILQEFTQYVANAGLTDFIAAECEQYHLLANSFVQSCTFLPRYNPPEVRFDLYVETHQIPLTEFCNICMIPSDGSLAEPRPAEFEALYRTLTVEMREGCQLSLPLACIFLLFITLLFSLQNACVLERRWVHSVH